MEEKAKHPGSDPRRGYMLKLVAIGAIGAFVLSGPLQHFGALPKSLVGDASKGMFKLVLDGTVKEAFGRCGGGGIVVKGNNGFGNGGLDGVPGKSANNKAPNARQKEADVVR
jgi:hypothetical protein